MTISISMGDVIYTNEGKTSLFLDQEYTSLAAQLQNKCFRISTHRLQQVPNDAEGRSLTYVFFRLKNESFFCHIAMVHSFHIRNDHNFIIIYKFTINFLVTGFCACHVIVIYP